MPYPVVHFETIGENQQLLNNFYKSIFDWQITPIMDEYSLVNTGSGIPRGVGAMGKAPQHVTFYVEVAKRRRRWLRSRATLCKEPSGRNRCPPEPSSPGSPIPRVTW